ncbi:MAG: outer membrane beta-barrel protein [Bacteroidia bacterium]|nr:outer membrane beta-barrel protein [Bacteroidia bacterium]
MKAVKTLLLVAVFGFVATAASAQISAGTMFISGDASFSSEKFEPTGGSEETFTSGLIGPRFGYFVSDNLAVGVRVGFGGSKFEEEGFEFQSTAFEVGVFGRYYNMFNDNFGLFGELGVGIVSSTDEEDGTEVGKSNGIDAGLGLGFTFFPSTRFALEGSAGLVGFTSLTNEDPDGNELSKESGFNIGVGNTAITLSASWYFNR